MPSTGGVKIGGSYDEARTRKVNAEAEIAEMELAKVRNQLVIVDDVVSAWTDVLGNLKSKLLNIAVKAAPLVSVETEPEVIQGILSDLVNESLEELSGYEPKIKASRASGSKKEAVGGNGDSQTASRPKRGRVGRPPKTARLNAGG